MSNIDLEKLAAATYDELLSRAKQLGSRLIESDKKVLAEIAKDMASEAIHKATTGETRQLEWNHIYAQGLNVTATDALLFRQAVIQAGDFLTGVLKAVVKVVT